MLDTYMRKPEATISVAHPYIEAFLGYTVEIMAATDPAEIEEFMESRRNVSPRENGDTGQGSALSEAELRELGLLEDDDNE